MTKAISDNRKSRGRPKTGAVLIGVRIEPAMLDKIDALRARHNPPPSRPEAIRQIIEATFRLMGDEGLDSPKK